jgi:hypothetical protein
VGSKVGEGLRVEERKVEASRMSDWQFIPGYVRKACLKVEVAEDK